VTVTVLLLSQRNCGYCDAAKAILDRLSAKYPIAVSTVSLDTPEGQRLAEKHAILFPPGILIDGAAFAYGRPSEPKLRREIERRLAGGRIAAVIGS
jgi:thiol-disulfide isomerase/thioredoxin